MAYYSDGNRLLTSDEYYAEVIFKWKLCLFVIGSLIVGFTVYVSLPQEWDKALRFSLIIAAGASGGGLLSHFVREIEALSAWVVRLAVLFIIGCVVWNLI